MTNPATPPRTIEIGGRAYILDYSRASWAIAEGRLKTPLLGPGAAEFWASGASQYQTCVLLFVGLCRANPGLTLDDAASMLTFDNMNIDEQIADAAMSSFPAPKPAEGEQSADPSRVITGS